MKTELRSLLLLAASLFVSGCQSQHPTVSSTSSLRSAAPAGVKTYTTASGGSYDIPDALVSLNKLFLDGYTNRQAVLKSNTSPVIVANFSTLILYRNGIAETNAVIPDIYHSLKAIAHVPFGIFLRIEPHTKPTSSKLPAEVVSQLRLYRERITAAEASLPNVGFSNSQLQRQHEILNTCKSYLDSTIGTGYSSHEDLLAFAHKVGPLILANADDAARAQIDLTHQVVMQWKSKMPSDEWNQLIVVVRGFQMARRLNICTQYFAKALNEPPNNLGYPLESRRLIYAEFIMRGRDHLDLMTTTLIDGDASEAFFGDRWRMSRDVLADGATEYLKGLHFD